MAYVAPKTWASGNKPTAAEFNQDIRDNVSFLANPPACRVYHNTTQSINDNSETALVFNSERYDTDGMHSTSVNTGRITINTAGLYLVTFTGRFSAADTDYLSTYIRIQADADSNQIIAWASEGTMTDNNSGPGFSVATVYKFAAGEYIEVKAFQNNTSGNANNIIASSQESPEFSATWIGLG